MESYEQNYGTTVDRERCVDVDTFHPKDPQPAAGMQEKQGELGGAPYALPAPTGDDQAINLTVGGGAATLDHLGPVIVNTDGTISRIANWDKMTEREREVAKRRLGARNQVRLGNLREAAGEDRI